MNAAKQKLKQAQLETGSLLCVGLEPCAEYQPPSVADNLQGYEEFLRLIVEATTGLVSAYKINLAFFESLGWEGLELLYALRETIPDNAFLIADGKRGDIGTTARHYAKAIFDQLGADAATVNPLMGKDSVEPFLAYGEKLNYLLTLTSNPGADDFLLPNDLYMTIARKAKEWDSRGNTGLVAGATRPDQLTAIKEVAPLPMLIPGVGAQGGDLPAVLAALKPQPGEALIHVTRGILPGTETGDLQEIIQRKTRDWNERIRAAQQEAGV